MFNKKQNNEPDYTIRQWCVERVMEQHHHDPEHLTIQAVIGMARMLEGYILKKSHHFQEGESD